MKSSLHTLGAALIATALIGLDGNASPYSVKSPTLGTTGPDAVPVGSLSDRVILDDRFYGYQDTVIPEGNEGIVSVGYSAVYYAYPINIFLLEPGTRIISDHLFNIPGQFPDGDQIFFASDPSADPLIGTLYTGDPRFAIEEDGTLQDVSHIVGLQNGGLGIFAGGRILVQSDVDAVPDGASTLGLFGLALFGMAAAGRSLKRA